MKEWGQYWKVISSLPAWIGMLAIALQINAVPLDYMLFRLNQDHIARTLCEHKAPHCNGHCFLMKQISKSESANTDKQSEHLNFQLDGQFLCVAENNVALFPSSFQFRIMSGQEIAPGWSPSLLQPPRFA